MAEFAKADFALSVKQEDGYTLREHLLSAWDQSGQIPQEFIDQPELPASVAYLWEYYCELHNQRGNNGWGHVDLTYLELNEWQRARKTKLDAWELDAILAIDKAYIASLPKPKPGPT